MDIYRMTRSTIRKFIEGFIVFTLTLAVFATFNVVKNYQERMEQRNKIQQTSIMQLTQYTRGLDEIVSFAKLTKDIQRMGIMADCTSTIMHLGIKEIVSLEVQQFVCDSYTLAASCCEQKAALDNSFLTLFSEDNNGLTSRDMEILYRIVEAEAGGGEMINKQYVASVILNRVRSDEFPDTVEGVVFQKGQYSPISDKRYWQVTISPSTIEAVDYTVSHPDITQGALYFAQLSKVKNKATVEWFWTLEYLFTDEIGHSFFK